MKTEQPKPITWKDFQPHFEDLRWRMLWSIVALIVATVASFSLAEQFIELLARPIGGIDQLQAIEVTENVSVFMRVSMLSGFILAFPILLWQIIAFIAPALKPSEKRWLYFSIPLATALFVAGVLFAYFVMLPTAVPFLTTFMGIRNVPRPANYINFVTSLLFWIGVSFEAPLLVYLMARLGWVTSAILIKGWRLAVVIIAILAAVITPTIDPVSMGLLMAPLLVLYALSIGMAALAGRARDRQSAG